MITRSERHPLNIPANEWHPVPDPTSDDTILVSVESDIKLPNGGSADVYLYQLEPSEILDHFYVDVPVGTSFKTIVTLQGILPEGKQCYIEASLNGEGATADVAENGYWTLGD